MPSVSAAHPPGSRLSLASSPPLPLRCWPIACRPYWRSIQPYTVPPSEPSPSSGSSSGLSSSTASPSIPANSRSSKNSIGQLTSDPSLQALLIAFSFGAFLEGAAGFGTPVAVAAAILGGLGFSAFNAAAVCLLANTAPCGFRLHRHPAGHTSPPPPACPLKISASCRGPPVRAHIADHPRLSGARHGRSQRALRRASGPPRLVCGVSFASVQFVVSNFIGPYLTDILSSLAAIVSLIVVAYRSGDLMACGEIASQYALQPASNRPPRGSPIFCWSSSSLFWSVGGMKDHPQLGQPGIVPLARPAQHDRRTTSARCRPKRSPTPPSIASVIWPKRAPPAPSRHSPAHCVLRVKSHVVYLRIMAASAVPVEAGHSSASLRFWRSPLS